MSLQVWLPLNGDLRNQGCSNITTTNINATIDSSGKIGKCYNFAGSGQRIKFTNPITNGINSFSICTWFYITAVDGALFGARTSGSGKGLLGFLYADRILFDDGARFICNYNINNLLNSWHHITFVKTPTQKIIYIDGILVGSYNTTAVTATIKNEITIGNDSYEKYTDNDLIGKLNDFRIYDHALSAAEVKEISQGLVLHYKLDQSNPNLISSDTFINAPWATAIAAHEEYEGRLAYRLQCRTLYTNTSSGTVNIFPDITYQENTQYTLSITWRDDYRTDSKNSNLRITFHYTDGSATHRIQSPANTVSSWIHTKITSNAGKTLSKITASYGNSGYLYITDLKLEIGTLDTGMLYTDGRVQDSSGYGHNGTSNNIVLVTDSARFNNASQFNGTNSYIKVIDNDIMIQGMEALTINLWAKNSSWPTNGGRLFSCTETGGFNSEGGNSGYWRFPIHVYTNAEQTSTAYKYDSKEIKISDLPVDNWVMITWVYNTTGTRTYINGTLHHTYTNTSYGIHFNKNARLFLGCEANTASPYTPYYNGQMSDFRLYTTALSAEDIKQLYQVSAKVDNKQNLHAFELVENNSKIQITKQGQVKCNELEEDEQTKFYQTDQIIETNEIIEL